MDPVSNASSRFRIGAVVASGGMGRIHRAIDATSGETVAIKVLADDDAEARARFVRECRALAGTTHPGIVRYVAHGQLEDGAPYLAMEWLEGLDLRARLARTEAPLSLRDVLLLGRRVASALGALHTMGFVHRDVKPANVFLPGGLAERAKLLDLGVARHGASRDVTGTGVLVGTPWYMAPEQARGEHDLGPPCDVFALGAVLYECVTGTSPFHADHVVAGLAKILLEDPPAPHDIAPHVPRGLSDRIMLLLRKEPGERPADGAGAARLLEEIEIDDAVPAVGGPDLAVAASGTRRVGIGEGEVRVACLLVARGHDRHVDPHETGLLPETLASVARDLFVLADGSLVLRPGESLLPRDQAERAARAALALRTLSPAMRTALTMGRASGTRGPVGDVVDRAARSLAEAPPGAIRVDALVASLLAHRFVIENGTLVGERPAEAPRTLLGRPTTLVGRRRELALLEATYAEVAEERVARAVLVTGIAGMGKSRLLRELGRTFADAEPPPFVIDARGDAAASGSPWLLLAPALRRAAGIAPGDESGARRDKIRALVKGARDEEDVASFVTELAGVPIEAPVPPALAAARADPALLVERMRGAFVALARHVTETQPLVLVLDDLHWGDLPSVRLVEAALAALADRPLFVLALARPEVRTAFPELFAAHGATTIQLDALGPRASADLVRQALGADVAPATIDAIVGRASGNAFHLEELIRAAAEGDGALPDTLVATLQARVLALSTEARRLLRAASVLGESCAIEAAEALLDTSSLAYRVEDWLDDLVRKELLEVSGGVLRFRHALVRDAVYAMLTDEDRALGHGLAAAWLEAHGERDARLLAGHLLAAGARDRAVPFLVEAAAQSLESNDVEAALRHAEHALREGATEALAGRAHGLAATAAYWKSDYAASVAHGEAALGALRAGSKAWLVAAGATLVSLARLGEPARFDVLFARLREVEPDDDARAEHVVALCRGTFQPIFRARFAEADRTLARIAVLVGATELDAGTLAQAHHVTGVRAAMVGDVGTFLVHLGRAVDAFETAGDRRNVLLERTTLGWCWAELGDAARAVAMIEENLAACREANVAQAITYAKVNLGYALALAERGLEAEATLREAIAECGAVKNQRLEGWARAHLAALALATSRAETARDEAARAVALLAGSPSLRAWALAVEARAHAACGDPETGLARADAAMDGLRELGGLLQGGSWPPLARAECLAALGRPEAEAAVVEARARLIERADRLADPATRATFLARADSRAVLALEPRKVANSRVP